MPQHSPSTAGSAEAYRTWGETFSSGGKAVWKQKPGLVTRTGKSELVLPRDFGYFGYVSREAAASAEVKEVAAMLSDMRTVFAGVPRSLRTHLSVVLLKEGRVDPQLEAERMPLLLERIASLFLRKDPAFAELNAILARLNLPAVTIGRVNTKDTEFLYFLTKDGVEISRLSDGTLRMIEILLAVIASSPGALIMIEEPETGVHPGMLNKLLSELATYADDRQIVLTTHSPDVVARFKPASLRLVSRTARKTTIAKVNAEESKRLKAFLKSEGDLGEFVFGGGIEEAS
jgi:AAA domain, putative AbiEii toxin, Type IV TA system